MFFERYYELVQGTYESYAYCAYELVQLYAATSQEEQKNLFHYSFSTPSA